jgi:c-di-GMP-binding flagellar brake protein YcgR
MERRALARRRAPIKRIYAADILGEADVEHCLVHIHDLSEGGMRIHTEYNFPADASVSLRLHLEEPIDVTVKRVWEKPLVGGMNVYGLQFDVLAEPSKVKLHNFLQQNFQENRRKSFRLNRILVVELELDNESSRFGVFTLDMSSTGMRINHEEPLPDNRDLKFRILLEPGTDPVPVTARVSWQKENAFGHFLIGLQFTDVSDEAKERIETYVESTAKNAGSSSPGSDAGLGSFLPNA